MGSINLQLRKNKFDFNRYSHVQGFWLCEYLSTSKTKLFGLVMPPTKTRAAIVVYFIFTDNGTQCVDTSKTLENRIKITMNFKNILIRKLTSLLYKRFYYEVLVQLNYTS